MTASSSSSAAKVFQVLELFADQHRPISAESVARVLRFPLSSTYRYLALLKEFSYIDDDGSGGYALSPAILRFTRGLNRSRDISTFAKPYMQRLCEDTGETVILVERAQDTAVCTARVESSSRFRLSFDVGTSLPLDRGAGPKCLLANLPPEEIEEFLKRPRVANGNRRKLTVELDVIRKQGWSTSHAEITPHVFAVAAPIRVGVETIAAVSVVGPVVRMPPRSQDRLLKKVRATAREITENWIGRAD